MIKSAKSKRGGSRANAGRKRDPLKDIRTGAVTAQKFLREIEAEKELKAIYPDLTPAQKLQVIFKMRESAYGRPATSEEQQKPGPTQINVNIRRIGS